MSLVGPHINSPNKSTDDFLWPLLLTLKGIFQMTSLLIVDFERADGIMCISP